MKPFKIIPVPAPGPAALRLEYEGRAAFDLDPLFPPLAPDHYAVRAEFAVVDAAAPETAGRLGIRADGSVDSCDVTTTAVGGCPPTRPPPRSAVPGDALGGQLSLDPDVDVSEGTGPASLTTEAVYVFSTVEDAKSGLTAMLNLGAVPIPARPAFHLYVVTAIEGTLPPAGARLGLGIFVAIPVARGIPS